MKGLHVAVKAGRKPRPQSLIDNILRKRPQIHAIYLVGGSKNNGNLGIFGVLPEKSGRLKQPLQQHCEVKPAARSSRLLREAGRDCIGGRICELSRSLPNNAVG